MLTARALRAAGSIAAVYGLWLITIAVALAGLIVWHQLFLKTYVRFGFDKWAIGFFNDVFIIVAAIAWLSWTVIAESLYRSRGGGPALLPLAGRIVLVEAAVAAVSYAILLWV